MKRALWIALAGGGGLLLLFLGSAVLVWRLGVHVDPLAPLTGVVALTAALVMTGVIFLVLDRPAAPPVYVPAKLTEDPVLHFVSPFVAPGVIEVLAQPRLTVERMLLRQTSVFEKPAEHNDRKVLLKIQKTLEKREEAVFNPVILRDLFEKLKAFDRSEHILLLDEREQFIGYIPWANAIKDFTGENAETKIRNAIVNVLANPHDAKSVKALRAMNGMGADDCISDTATIRDAAKMMWGTVPGEKPREEPAVNGLVLYHGAKISRPVGVLTKVSLLQLVATGA
jgi:hypothetical protein